MHAHICKRTRTRVLARTCQCAHACVCSACQCTGTSHAGTSSSACQQVPRRADVCRLRNAVPHRVPFACTRAPAHTRSMPCVSKVRFTVQGVCLESRAHWSILQVPHAWHTRWMHAYPHSRTHSRIHMHGHMRARTHPYPCANAHTQSRLAMEMRLPPSLVILGTVQCSMTGSDVVAMVCPAHTHEHAHAYARASSRAHVPNIYTNPAASWRGRVVCQSTVEDRCAAGVRICIRLCRKAAPLVPPDAGTHACMLAHVRAHTRTPAHGCMPVHTPAHAGLFQRWPRFGNLEPMPL